MQPTNVDHTTGEQAATEDRSAGIASLGRRRFLRAALGFSVVSTIAMILTPIVGFLIPPKSTGGAGVGRVPVGATADLPVGSGSVVAMGSKPVIVVNTAAGLKAYSAVCTHLGCIVAFDPAADAIVCPCHDGRFSPTNGSVISGPPPQPLPPIAVAVEKDQIYLVSG